MLIKNDITRRTFLKKASLLTVGTCLAPSFLCSCNSLLKGLSQGKKIVIVQLSGGNDGLNTFVSYRNDLYYKNRPNLAIAESKLLKVDDAYGFHPSALGLKDLYDQGLVSIVHNVGYPNPNRSHFRLMDIWQTASAADEFLNTGWLGRYLDAECPNKPYSTIQVGNELALALRGKNENGISLTDPRMANAMMSKLASGEHYPEHDEPELVDYLYRVLTSSKFSLDEINEKFTYSKPKVKYPKSEFAQRLRLISQLIASDLETKVYYVSLGGFDTHVQQANTHAELLSQLGYGLNAFCKDLKANNKMDEVLVMCFSEFGRRVNENGAIGTDHGTANIVLFVGEKLQTPGAFNAGPDLENLHEMDLIHSVDFRSIYSTLLTDWLGVDSKKIINGQFGKIKLLKA